MKIQAHPKNEFEDNLRQYPSKCFSSLRYFWDADSLIQYSSSQIIRLRARKLSLPQYCFKPLYLQIKNLDTSQTIFGRPCYSE